MERQDIKQSYMQKQETPPIVIYNREAMLRSVKRAAIKCAIIGSILWAIFGALIEMDNSTEQLIAGVKGGALGGAFLGALYGAIKKGIGWVIVAKIPGAIKKGTDFFESEGMVVGAMVGAFWALFIWQFWENLRSPWREFGGG